VLIKTNTISYYIFLSMLEASELLKVFNFSNMSGECKRIPSCLGEIGGVPNLLRFTKKHRFLAFLAFQP
jgi:hypothetical protein